MIIFLKTVLTVAAVLVISKVTGMDIILALTHLQGVILVGIVNFSDGETNVLE